MTDLDKKVAEAKGWRYSPFGEEKERNSSTGQVFPMSEGFVYVQGESTYHVAGWACNWSTDTAKAFELVDEVGFRLTLQGEKDDWFAVIWALEKPDDKFPNPIKEYGETRAEAICRAYIALKEWEKKR